VLQQQSRNNRYRKYFELINVLLAAETQNEILMKNYNMRPVGSNALPEAHANFQKKPKTFFKKGSYSKKHGHKEGKFKKQFNMARRLTAKAKLRPRVARKVMQMRVSIQTRVVSFVDQ